MRQHALTTTILAILLAGLAPPLCGRQGFPRLSARPKTWGWTAGAALGVLLGPGEIGRHRNATGGREELVARLGDGMALGVHAGIETRLGGFELRAVQTGHAVQVRNEFGVAFPNHGGRPLLWAASVMLYPLAPLQGKRSHSLQPFLTAGLGGMLVSVDLDNVKDQTLYHPFHWSLGGGVRIASSPDDIPGWTPSCIELRVARFRVWRNRPLRRFDALAATVGLGLRW